MDRADLLKANAAIFEAQGKALDQYASRKVKVLVVGNPCNTNALIACKNAPSLSSACFAAMARLDENRAKSVLARKTGQRAGTIKNVCIFGNHSKTLVVDADHAYISTGDSRHHQSVRSAVADDAFLDSDLITEVQLRGSVILGARGVSSAPSAAKAAVDTMRDWVMGTPEGEWSNMAVPTDGSAYGVPEGLVCAFPLACKNGEYSVVKGLRLSGGTREKLKVSIDELVNERAAAGGQEEKDADK